MPPRTIVGIGEALLAETPQRRPDGLALRVAIEAARLGHVGLAISRLGQDRFAEELLALILERGLASTHLQSDPDLPTGRVATRVIGSARRRAIDQDAFDNLQWDYDLTDVAHQTDAAIFGLYASRYTQTRSVVQQFLGECTNALRILDLTNRPPGERGDRGVAVALAGEADVVVTDRDALQLLFPGPATRSSEELALQAVRHHKVALVLLVEPHGGSSLGLAMLDGSQRWDATRACPSGDLPAAIVTTAHGLLGGLDPSATLDLVARVIEHVERHPDLPVPQTLLAPA